MNLDPKDGGQVLTAQRSASPNVTENIPVVLNLRDHFAGLALTALSNRLALSEVYDGECAGRAAKAAYIYADAMLEARKQ